MLSAVIALTVLASYYGFKKWKYFKYILISLIPILITIGFSKNQKVFLLNHAIAIFNNVSKENLYCLTKYRYFSTEEASEPFIINKFGEIKYINSLPSKKDINLNEYKNKELKNAKNNAKILDFDTKKEICQKVVEENLKKDEWIIIAPFGLKTNTLYQFSDETNKINKIFLLKNDGSVDWY